MTFPWLVISYEHIIHKMTHLSLSYTAADDDIRLSGYARPKGRGVQCLRGRWAALPANLQQNCLVCNSSILKLMLKAIDYGRSRRGNTAQLATDGANSAQYGNHLSRFGVVVESGNECSGKRISRILLCCYHYSCVCCWWPAQSVRWEIGWPSWAESE